MPWPGWLPAGALLVGVMYSDGSASSELSRDECLRLLASVPVGRVIYTRRAMPAVQLVNFALDHGDIVIRTDQQQESHRRRSRRRGRLQSRLPGRCSAVRLERHRHRAVAGSDGIDPEEIGRLHTIGLSWWGLGEREYFIRVSPVIMNGRYLRATRRLVANLRWVTQSGAPRQGAHSLMLASGSRRVTRPPRPTPPAAPRAAPSVIVCGYPPSRAPRLAGGNRTRSSLPPPSGGTAVLQGRMVPCQPWQRGRSRDFGGGLAQWVSVASDQPYLMVSVPWTRLALSRWVSRLRPSAGWATAPVELDGVLLIQVVLVRGGCHSGARRRDRWIITPRDPRQKQAGVPAGVPAGRNADVDMRM